MKVHSSFVLVLVLVIEFDRRLPPRPKDSPPMRMIGRIDNEKRAAQFSDVLFAHSIENEIESGQSGWIVWAMDDERVAEAKALLERFTLDPDNEAFQKARREGRRKWNEARREESAPRPPATDLRTHMHLERSAIHFPLTLAMVLFSVGVAAASNAGDDDNFLRHLTITSFWFTESAGYIYTPLKQTLSKGEVWRLVTPIFIHYGILHILFNMMWLLDLGRMIETRRGPFYFAALVLLIAIPSNLAQYWVDDAAFGGMSGVIFGLVGYIWTRNKFSYEEIYPLSGNEMQLMVVWFIVCFLGLVGPVANTAHGVGMAVGMLIGYLFSHKFRRIFRGKA